MSPRKSTEASVLPEPEDLSLGEEADIVATTPIEGVDQTPDGNGYEIPDDLDTYMADIDGFEDVLADSDMEEAQAGDHPSSDVAVPEASNSDAVADAPDSGSPVQASGSGSGHGRRQGTRRSRGAWSEYEEQCCRPAMQWALENHKDATVVERWELMSEHLADIYGVYRSGAAIKDHWNRHLRKKFNFDERKRPKPYRMSTCIQKGSKKQGSDTTTTADASPSRAQKLPRATYTPSAAASAPVVAPSSAAASPSRAREVARATYAPSLLRSDTTSDAPAASRLRPLRAPVAASSAAAPSSSTNAFPSRAREAPRTTFGPSPLRSVTTSGTPAASPFRPRRALPVPPFAPAIPPPNDVPAHRAMRIVGQTVIDMFPAWTGLPRPSTAPIIHSHVMAAFAPQLASMNVRGSAPAAAPAPGPEPVRAPASAPDPVAPSRATHNPGAPYGPAAASNNGDERGSPAAAGDAGAGDNETEASLRAGFIPFFKWVGGPKRGAGR